MRASSAAPSATATCAERWACSIFAAPAQPRPHRFAPVAAVHALAFPIGGRFHVRHGLSNSLVMAPVTRFNAPAAAAVYAELAPIMFPKIDGKTDAEKADAMIEGIAALIAETGLETRFGQVDISRNYVPMLAEDAMKQTRLLVNNPRDVAYNDSLKTCEAAL
jgi:alcohol dehydrogenase class IV